MLLGEIQSLSAEADGLRYTARLHDGLPTLLLEGLRSGQYGSSFRARPVKSHYERLPRRSAYNPEGLMEVTRTELRLSDVGPTSLPAYSATEARLRSLTDTAALRAVEESSRGSRPAWYLGDLHADREREPYWKIQRKERGGHTFCKA